LSTKKRGGGSIFDRPLKEYKFCTGIAKHGIVRKANSMIKYLGKEHPIKVTPMAQQRSLKDNANAIHTRLKKVRAVEARGMKSNNQNSYGTLLLHPSKK
jgi:translation initiation factor IF-3